MRLVRYEHAGEIGIGVQTGDRVAPTGHRTMLEVIEAGESGLAAAAEATTRTGAIEGARILAPIPAPGKILCCGVNYLSHKDENPGATLPSEPFFFSKLPSAVVGPDDPIVIPAPDSQIDWEVELAAVIGRTARRVAAADALDHVFGYTILHDVSGRDVQFKDNQITLGKGFDSFCPLGPCVTLKDEVPDPQVLTLSTYLNGERVQHDATSSQLFGVATLIEFLSRHITLYPGDIVSTGTPAGVGSVRKPRVWLKPGDEVVIKSPTLGTLRTQIA
jgi:2-keto-4-pentenoate hydratase/2-oxohepta-3-ene-1,7-dioic acid hydratase in catechol pathway